MRGLDQLKTKSIYHHPHLSECWYLIEEFILKSECKKIDIGPIKFGLAVSLSSGVILSDRAFNLPLPNFIFTIFHEFAHQHQFKKYGKDKMLELYTKDWTIEFSALKMKDIEVTADEFAKRKMRQLQKKGFLKNISIPNGIYSNLELEFYVKTLSFIKSSIPSIKGTNTDEIDDLFYRWLTS